MKRRRGQDEEREQKMFCVLRERGKQCQSPSEKAADAGIVIRRRVLILC
jgi:hypothetical protein